MIWLPSRSAQMILTGGEFDAHGMEPAAVLSRVAVSRGRAPADLHGGLPPSEFGGGDGAQPAGP